MSNQGPIDLGELKSPEEAAAALRVKFATLATWRAQRRGPPFVKIGRRVFYLRRDLEAWAGSRWVAPDEFRKFA
jgi:Helix-turn-helix domain